MLFEINYQARALEYIYHLHDARINAVVVNQVVERHARRNAPLPRGSALQVRTTNSYACGRWTSPRFSWKWRSLALSPDGLHVLVATEGNVIGVLNITDHTYHNKQRAHTNGVLAVACHPHKDVVATVRRSRPH